MAGKYGSLFRWLMVLLHVFVAILFLLAALAPFVDPEKWWFTGVLALGMPILLIILILFLFFWLVVRPKYALISLAALALGFKSIVAIFAFNAPASFKYEKPKEVLRVVDWNVARFIELKRNNNKGSQTRKKMLDLIKEQNADVLCLQEFHTSVDTGYYNNIRYIMENLDYKYFCYSWDYDADNHWTGQAIFSRYPIVDSGMIRFPKPGLREALLHADIVFKKDTIRFYTTHLQSVLFKKNDYESIEEMKTADDSLLENSKNIFSKLSRAMIYRSRQARIVKEILANSPYPYIIAGDFNDVPNSYTYFTILGDDLSDAFLENGFGMGRTYSALSPTLRIDYILHSKDIRVKQFTRLIKNYSDHYMLVADLVRNNKSDSATKK
jgi:endonuclease/exonuclease/phosphatase family metal-dependent hydrolase